MAHLSFRTLRSSLQSSETSWIVAWKWMLRKEVEEKSCFRLEKNPSMLSPLFQLTNTDWCEFSLFSPSIPSWSWRSHFPVSHLSSWQPRRRWRAIASLSTELPCLPMLCTDTCQPNSFFFCLFFLFFLFSCQTIGCEWLASLDAPAFKKKSPDKPHCEEDQKSSTTPAPSRPPLPTQTLVFRSDIRRQVKLKCLVSE